MTIHLQFGAASQGWLPADLVVDDVPLRFDVSDTPADFPLELINALHCALRYDGTYVATASEERTESDWTLIRTQDTAAFSIIQYPDTRRGQGLGKKIVETSGPLLEVVLPFWLALRELEGRCAKEDYNTHWSQEFPSEELAQLTFRIGLHDPSSRQRALKAIRPTRESARQNRTTLRFILAEEMKYRANDEPEPDPQEGECAYFEHLYWCSFLLYLAGDPQDSLLVWDAKQINFDTSVGMCGQCLVGAGYEATRRFLADNQAWEVLEYVDVLKKCGDLDDLPAFERGRAQYFYDDVK